MAAPTKERYALKVKVSNLLKTLLVLLFLFAMTFFNLLGRQASKLVEMIFANTPKGITIIGCIIAPMIMVRTPSDSLDTATI